MEEVEQFIELHEGEQRKLLKYFHSWLTEELGLMPKLRFKVPFYYMKSWVCYLNPTSDGIEFAFPRGNELSNFQGLLSSKGRKQVSSVEFAAMADVPVETLQEVVHEAILLDDVVPYAPKRKK